MNKSELSVEERFKILRNVEKYAAVTEKITANDGYCIKQKNKTEATRCMCRDFTESNAEGPCKCGRFIKAKRTDHEIAQYKKLTPWALEEQRKKEATEKKNDGGKQKYREATE